MSRNGEAHEAFAGARNHHENGRIIDREHPLVQHLKGPYAASTLGQLDAEDGGALTANMGLSFISEARHDEGPGVMHLSGAEFFPPKEFHPGMKMDWDDD